MTSVPVPAIVEGGATSAPLEPPSRHAEALNEALGGVAHDFSNVFAVILSYANFIRESSPEDDTRREDALEILRAADEGTALIRRLLGIGERATLQRPIDLNHALPQLKSVLLRSLGDETDLVLRTADVPVVVRMDPVQLDEVVLALTRVARDDTNGGPLEVAVELRSQKRPSARVTGAAARLTIVGNGPVASQRTVSNEQLLSLAERVVTAAAGSLDLEIDAAGSSAFVVELPLYTEHPARDGWAASGTGQRILLVEREAALRWAEARALSRAGYDVRVAADYDEAVAIIHQLGARLDVLIDDLSMPGCQHYQLVDIARRIVPTAVILAATAFVTEATEARSAQGVVHVSKLVRPGELASLVQRALSEKRPTEPERATQTESVLVVEDNDIMRAALTRILEANGYSVAQAASLGEARSSLEGGSEPTLVLCDLCLPDGSGAEFVRWLLGSRPTLRERVFILSGGAVDEADARFVESGLVPVLRKPIDPNRMLQMLRQTSSGRDGAE